jgi:multidrug transporter EmrE-like cation transporter
VTTPVSSILLVILSSFIGSFGAVFLKVGATRLHFEWKTVIYNWPLALGIVLFLCSSVFFIMGVRHGELTILYPMVSIGYVCTMVWSRIFFGEPFTRNKFLGLGMIMLGIACLNLGNR